MGELLTAGHVAKRSGISPAILRQPKWRRLHGLPAVRIGRLLRFEPDAVAAFCERQREGTDRAAARRPSPACRRARGGARRRRGDLHPVRLSAARRACNRRPSQPARDPCARIVAPLRSRRVDEGHRVADAAELDVVNCHRRQRGAGGRARGALGDRAGAARPSSIRERPPVASPVSALRARRVRRLRQAVSGTAGER
jgi:hypothetical protein